MPPLPKKYLNEKPVEEKVKYVKSQGQTRLHHCHWPGCSTQVPPAMWGCTHHWFCLPRPIRNKIWNAYTEGQEVTMTPSEEYLDAAQEAQEWIAANFPDEVNNAQDSHSG